MIINQNADIKHAPGDMIKNAYLHLFAEHHPRLFERLVVFIVALAHPAVVMNASGAAATRSSNSVVIRSVIAIEV